MQYTLGGKTQSLTAWAEELGVPYKWLHYRVCVTKRLTLEEAAVLVLTANVIRQENKELSK